MKGEFAHFAEKGGCGEDNVCRQIQNVIAQGADGIIVDGKMNLCYSNLVAGIAQLVEQLIRNQQVACSSHVTSSRSPQVVDLR